MKHCSRCGAPVAFIVPRGDNRPRHVCTACSTIYYENPRIVTGCIPEWKDRLLLCRRAIEPRAGLWTLPAGFLESGETTTQGAIRETLEEALARVELLELYTVLHVPHIDQVHMMYRARLLDLDFHPGVESTEVQLFRPAELPWDEIAFPSVRHTLRFFMDDQSAGRFRLRVGDIIRGADGFSFQPGSVTGE